MAAAAVSRVWPALAPESEMIDTSIASTPGPLNPPVSTAQPETTNDVATVVPFPGASRAMDEALTGRTVSVAIGRPATASLKPQP